MTYLENGYLTFGYEFEGTGITLQQAQQIARDNNWKHIIVKRDGTHGVDFEINSQITRFALKLMKKLI